MSTVAKRSNAQPTLFGDAPNQPTPLAARRSRTIDDGELTISSRTRDLLDAATAIEQQDARESVPSDTPPGCGRNSPCPTKTHAMQDCGSVATVR